jgi:hypothetical protein
MKLLLPVLLALLLAQSSPAASAFASHAPMRPLPQPSTRPLPAGPHKFVDAARGDDAQAGTEARPWRTLAAAVTRLQPGDTLVLRGGLYREHVTVACAGTQERPIVIRAHPGELVVLDGGLAEFHDAPATAWEPFPAGAPGEFRSTRTYANAGSARTDDQQETTLLGSFADSMLPLQGCHTMGDLRTTNEFWTLAGEKVRGEKFIYCGPSIAYDPATQRIHARFAPTTLAGLGDDNYRGEADPRKLRLVIATLNAGPVLTLRGARCVRVQDLVVRGARAATVDVQDCAAIAFEGITAYGGAAAMRVQGTRGLRLVNCALRGIAAPWTFRSSLKYRSIEARVFSAGAWTPDGADNADFELAHSEFTDCVDGVFIGNVRGVDFHHNLVENISDDGLFLTCGTAPDGTTHGGDVRLWQNRFARCLTTFAFGVGHGRQKVLPTGRQTGAGVWIHNNVFDQRRWVPYFVPRSAEDPQEFTFMGRLAGDHGSPAWEPLCFYHNTVLSGDAPFRGGYLDGLGRAISPGSPRRLLNNIVVQAAGLPGAVFQEQNPDLIADANLHWSAAPGEAVDAAEFLRKLRGAKAALEGKARYPAGWSAQDQYADPQFVKFSPDPRAPVDVRLQSASPARNAGVPVPPDWPAPLRSAAARGDLGAIPFGTTPWRVGINGRLDASGQDAPPRPDIAHLSLALPNPAALPARAGRPIAVVEGYPAFDVPLIMHALRKQGARIHRVERNWLDTARWAEFSAVIFAGNLVRAQSPVTKFAPEDFPRVRAYLEGGGVLVLLRGTAEMFATADGHDLLHNVTGGTARPAAGAVEILQPRHPWIQHLDAAAPHPWLAVKSAVPLRATRGERILGTPDGLVTLGRFPVGKGALIYLGWELAASLPDGRKPAAVEAERIYEEQHQILHRILAALP